MKFAVSQKAFDSLFETICEETWGETTGIDEVFNTIKIVEETLNRMFKKEELEHFNRHLKDVSCEHLKKLKKIYEDEQREEWDKKTEDEKNKERKNINDKLDALKKETEELSGKMKYICK